MPEKTEAQPDTPSSDYLKMEPFWTMVADILDGAPAMRKLPGNVNPYLPRFPNETTSDYIYRVENAKFTNIYRDIAETLAAKPFSDEVTLQDGASEDLKKLQEDIDGAGNHLFSFAGQSFFAGINNAVDWIMVDYVKMQPGSTLADERRVGARPYWVHVPARRVIAVYSARVGAKEILVHVRILESGMTRDGFEEIWTNRVRVYDRAPIVDLDSGKVVDYAPATFTVWEQKTEQKNGKSTSTWEVTDRGPITIGIIPMVPVIMGRRKEGTWQFIPPLQDAAYLQVEHFQQESGLKHISESAAFPMLAGNGVSPPTEPNPRAGEAGQPAEVPASIDVGPQSVLYAPPAQDGSHGEWKFIEPAGASLTFLAGQVKVTEDQLRELGRQPLTAQTGNITVVTAAFAGDKANSVIEAWALNMKDALENAWKITAMWLGVTAEPEVKMKTKFETGLSDKDAETLLKMREAGDLSHQTECEEFQRRGILSDEFEFEEEVKRLTEEGPADDEEADRQAAMTPPGGRQAA